MAKKDKQGTATKPKSKKEKPDTAAFRFFGALIEAIQWERLSAAGQVNLAVDFLLVAIIIVYLLSSTLTSIARIVSSIFNHDLTGGTGDNIVTLIVVFAILAAACVLFMHFTRKETEPFRKNEDGKQE